MEGNGCYARWCNGRYPRSFDSKVFKVNDTSLHELVIGKKEKPKKMTETKNMLLFRKWDTSGIEIIDPGLKTSISLRNSVLPYTYGRSALKRFNKNDTKHCRKTCQQIDALW